MQFLMTVKSDARQTPPTPELMAAMAQLTERNMKSGVMLQTGGMQMDSATTRMNLAGGKVSTIDGPFAESKELVGGYALVDVKSREDALALAREFLEIHAKVMGPGYAMETEIREMTPFAGIGIRATVPQR
jgi:hypothetical protein